MSNLKELRTQWETGLENLCEIPDFIDCFFVVLFKPANWGPNNTWYLHRYFVLGKEWVVSQDVKSTDVNDVFEFINNHRFTQVIPEKEN